MLNHLLPQPTDCHIYSLKQPPEEVGGGWETSHQRREEAIDWVYLTYRRGPGGSSLTDETVCWGRRQLIEGGSSLREETVLHWERRQFIEGGDHLLTGYQSSREDTSHSGRRWFVKGGNLLREEVIRQERGLFVRQGRGLSTRESTLHLRHGRIPFVGRGGRWLKEGGGHSVQEGEGHASWYELDLLWVWWEGRTW